MEAILMKRYLLGVVCLLVLVVSFQNPSYSQVTGMIGGKLGLGIADGNAGFLIGPGGEVIFSKRFAISSEINISTSTGTPVDWSNYFKALLSVPGSSIRPYVDGGISLLFYTGGPYFGLRFGGGALFPIARDLYAMGDLQLGPSFGGGTGVFILTMTGGIRYEIR